MRNASAPVAAPARTFTSNAKRMCVASVSIPPSPVDVSSEQDQSDDSGA